MVCIIRSEPSPVPRLWIGVVSLDGDNSRREDCLHPLAGHPVLEWVLARLRPQVSMMLLAGDGDLLQFASLDMPLIASRTVAGAGPLPAALAGMEWAATHAKDVPWVVTVAADAPFLPEDLVARLAQAVTEQQADAACVVSGGVERWSYGLWPTRWRRKLARALANGATVDRGNVLAYWLANWSVARAEYPDSPVDLFCRWEGEPPSA